MSLRHKLTDTLIPDDIPLTFPVDSNSPISPIEWGQISNDSDSRNHLITEGWINSQGSFRPFTSGDLIAMLESDIVNAGTILNRNSKPKIHVDLIVCDQTHGKRFLLRRVNMNLVYRDILNAVLNGTLTRMQCNDRE